MDYNSIQLHYQTKSKWNFNMHRGVSLNSILNLGFHLVVKLGYCQTLLFKKQRMWQRNLFPKLNLQEILQTKSRFSQFSIPKPFCNLCPLEDSQWLDSIILALYEVWMTSFFLPITCGRTRVGHLFYFLYNFRPNFWKFQTLKNPYLQKNLCSKYSHVLGFWIPKNLWLKVGFSKGFFNK
jgi:hypothetical protein